MSHPYDFEPPRGYTWSSREAWWASKSTRPCRPGIFYPPRALSTCPQFGPGSLRSRPSSLLPGGRTATTSPASNVSLNERRGSSSCMDGRRMDTTASRAAWSDELRRATQLRKNGAELSGGRSRRYSWPAVPATIAAMQIGAFRVRVGRGGPITWSRPPGPTSMSRRSADGSPRRRSISVWRLGRAVRGSRRGVDGLRWRLALAACGVALTACGQRSGAWRGRWGLRRGRLCWPMDLSKKYGRDESRGPFERMTIRCRYQDAEACSPSAVATAVSSKGTSPSWRETQAKPRAVAQGAAQPAADAARHPVHVRARDDAHRSRAPWSARTGALVAEHEGLS
jgi:hypothetical protein